jgi:hypothetical protein
VRFVFVRLVRVLLKRPRLKTEFEGLLRRSEKDSVETGAERRRRRVNQAAALGPQKRAKVKIETEDAQRPTS